MDVMEAISVVNTDIIREVQERCADIHTSGAAWTNDDALEIAALFRQSSDPIGLFTFVDEKTGHFSVGYRTRDDREWFHILRQMRNDHGCPLVDAIYAIS